VNAWGRDHEGRARPEAVSGYPLSGPEPSPLASVTVTGLIAADVLHAARQRLPAQLSRMWPLHPLRLPAISGDGCQLFRIGHCNSAYWSGR